VADGHPSVTDGVQALVEAMGEAAIAFGRTELLDRLRRATDRLVGSDTTVLVLGDYKQGKSTVVNALVGSDVCGTDVDEPTEVATIISVRPAGVHSPETGADQVVDLAIPASRLPADVVLIDAPGAGGLTSPWLVAALGTIDAMDGVIFVSDATQELTSLELDVLATCAQRCPQVVLALTKIDLFGPWRVVLERNRRHLRDASLDIPVIPVAPWIGLEAVRSSDRGLEIESGMPALEQWVIDRVRDSARVHAVRRALDDVGEVGLVLREQLAAEHRALVDAAGRTAALDALRAAEEQLAALASGATGWQTLLADGMSDLSSDLDHELRRRLRELLEEADRRIDAEDPGGIWDEFTAWLDRECVGVASSVRQLLVDRATNLSDAIAERLVTELSIPVASAVTEDLSPDASHSVADLEVARRNIVGDALTVARGSYSGILMVGAFAGLAGIPWAGPVGVVVGLALGRRQLKAERERVLAQRRHEARQAVRRHVDAVSAEIMKLARDDQRRVQRLLRDEWSTRVEELRRSRSEAHRQAQSLVEASEQEIRARTGDLDAEIARLDGLLDIARRLRAEVAP
jgi:signal recognition particle receptor subunit beta